MKKEEKIEYGIKVIDTIEKVNWGDRILPRVYGVRYGFNKEELIKEAENWIARTEENNKKYNKYIPGQYKIIDADKWE